MNFTIYFMCIFAALISGACSKEKESQPDTNEVIWAIKRYSKKIKKEKNIALRLYGVRCAGADKVYDGKIHEIDLGYSIDKNIKYEEARELFYLIVDGLVDELNKNEIIRDCFYHYPVTYEDFYFYLSFDYSSDKHLKCGDISMIAILDNKIKYFIVEEDGGNINLETRQIVPDVHVVTGSSPKIKCITKKLPEENLTLNSP